MHEDYAASIQGANRQQAHALYELALWDVTWTPREAMHRFGWSESEFEKNIKSLKRLGLVAENPSTPSGWVALPPQNALGDLLDEAKNRVSDFCADMSRAWESIFDVLTEFKTTYMSHLEENRVTVIDDPGAIAATLEREIRGATREVVLLGSGQALAAPLEQVCASVLKRGVTLRSVIRSSTAGTSQPVNILRGLQALGADLRTYPTLPLSFALIDCSTALFSAPAHRLSDDGKGRMVVVHSPLVNEVLRSVFDYYWSQSSAFAPSPARDSFPGNGEPLVFRSATTPIRKAPQSDSLQQTTLLRMLAGGMTDQAISRRLGVHERTVRRKVAEITASLKANSRFQAGVNAAKAGWLDEEAVRLQPEDSWTA
ncbi:LuxR C-terminal-related transcriptional regulator [Streptomyces sp. NPDC050315]|uniref:LuxR C-terminal-related transcriptional regulator n=1 Tax=Streptomyces sp. NPDC050315 TaxID=3155039 RepID=UPI00343784E7